MENKKMMKSYTIMWAVVAAVYGLWMSIFMGWDKFPYLTPTDEYYLLPAEEFIAKFDGIL